MRKMRVSSGVLPSESADRQMADRMGRDQHVQLHDALKDPRSALVSRVRDWMNKREFSADQDLRYSPLSESEKPIAKRPPPMFAQASVLDATEARLRKIGATLFPGSPAASLASSPTTTVFSTTSETTARTRIAS